jgi:hypothetical protein
MKRFAASLLVCIPLTMGCATLNDNAGKIVDSVEIAGKVLPGLICTFLKCETPEEPEAQP